jgi:TRAP-type mannitol/chloroaromatic compound transport system permease large subunit
MELIVLGVSFGLLLIIGVPVGFAVGLSSVATIITAGLPVAVVFQKMVGGMQVFSFLAIPFFIFAGELMLHGGIAHRIVRFANSLVGHVRGGLGMSNVLGCTLFGGFAGGRRVRDGLGDDSFDEKRGL